MKVTGNVSQNLRILHYAISSTYLHGSFSVTASLSLKINIDRWSCVCHHQSSFAALQWNAVRWNCWIRPITQLASSSLINSRSIIQVLCTAVKSRCRPQHESPSVSQIQILWNRNLNNTFLLQCFYRHSWQCRNVKVHRVRKKQATLLLPLTLPYTNRFSKFFHRQT